MQNTNDFLDQQRREGDSQSDLLLQSLSDQGQMGMLYALFGIKKDELIHQEESSLKDFLLHQAPKPDWLDDAKLEAGQRFYKKFATPIMTLLGGLSLPYCYAASPGNKALYLSQKMRQAPGRRLLDTAAFIICVSSPAGLSAQGEGHVEINKVRLIHSLSRYHILKSGNWQDEWGLPLNQEDMAGTNLAFSYLILRGLRRTGFNITRAEYEGFLHLWRYIGSQLNVHPDLLTDSMEEAGQLERAIVKRHFRFSKEGEILTKELIAYYKTLIPGAEKNLMDAQIRYWLGAKVSDCLGIHSDCIKDAAVFMINGVRNISNGFPPDKNSYQSMMDNHLRLRAQYDLEDPKNSLKVRPK